MSDYQNNPIAIKTRTGESIVISQATAGNLNVTEASGASIKTAVELIDNAVNTDGAAVGTALFAVGGTDGTNAQTLSVHTDGALKVYSIAQALPTGTNTIGKVRMTDGVDDALVTSAGELNVLDSNSAAIRTAVELIDNAVNADGTAISTGLFAVGGTDGTNAQTLSVHTDGALKVYSIAQALPAGDSILGRMKISDGTDVMLVNADGSLTVAGTGTFTVAGTVTANAGSGTFTTAVASIAAGDNNIGNIDLASGVPNITAAISLGALDTVTTLALAGASSAAYELTGTWVGTVSAYLSFDGGTTYRSVSTYDPASTTSSASSTANGSRQFTNTAGATHAQLKMTAWTSGTATGQITASSMAPGTQRSAFVYAEDSAHSSGALGAFVMGVRNDLAVTLSSADGEYIPFATDSAGRIGISDLGGTVSIDDGAGSITVDGTVSVSGTVTVDSELPAAAALADNASTPTAPAVGAFSMVYDGATWDMLRGTAVDGALVNLGANNDVTVTSGTVTANAGTGTFTVDSELPAATSITGDANAAPTAPAVYSYLVGYNSAQNDWERIQVDASINSISPTRALKVLPVAGSISLAGSAARTTTANGSDTACYFPGAEAVLDITFVSGTAPSLDVNIQQLDAVSGKYRTIYSFPQKTASGTTRVFLPGPHAGDMRATWTISGTTPSFTFSVAVTGSSASQAPVAQYKASAPSLSTGEAHPLLLKSNGDLVVTLDTETVTVDSELPAAALLADNASTPTAPAVGAFAMVYDGATWDMLRGTAADGALVNLGANNDVTVTSGTITANAGTGSFTVAQATAASLNMTEASAASIKTAVELIDNAVNTDGSAVGTGLFAVGGTDGTNAQTFSVHTDGALKVYSIAQALPAGTNNMGKVVLTDGTDDATILGTGDTATGAKGLLALGSDGTNVRALLTATGGALIVAQSTAANLNMTEANSAAIKTAVELIDNAVNTDGSAVGTGLFAVGGTDGTNAQTFSVHTDGAMKVYSIAQALPTGANNIGKVTLNSGAADISATNPLPVRIESDVASHTVLDKVSEGADADGDFTFVTGSSFDDVAAGSEVVIKTPDLTGATTGKVIELTAASAAPLKITLAVYDGTTETVKRIFFTQANSTLIYHPADKDLITQAGGANKVFRVKIKNIHDANASDVYCSLSYLEG